MGMLDKFRKNNANNYNDGYDDYYAPEGEENYDDYAAPAEENAPAEPAQAYGNQGYNPAPAYGYQTSAPSAAGVSLNGAAIELKVVKPTAFKDGTSIAEHLLSKRTVVLNLEEADKDTQRRLIDFLFGVAYSIGGEIKKVANNAYVITPQNVAISNDTGNTEAAENKDAAPAPQMGGYYGY